MKNKVQFQKGYSLSEFMMVKPCPVSSSWMMSIGEESIAAINVAEAHRIRCRLLQKESH